MDARNGGKESLELSSSSPTISSTAVPSLDMFLLGLASGTICRISGKLPDAALDEWTAWLCRGCPFMSVCQLGQHCTLEKTIATPRDLGPGALGKPLGFGSVGVRRVRSSYPTAPRSISDLM